MDLPTLFLCPACGGALCEGPRCGACARRYPAVATIPCLLPDPDAWTEGWGRALHAFMSQAAGNIAAIERQTDVPLPSARARLDRLRVGLTENAETIRDLLLGAGIAPVAEPGPLPGGLLDVYVQTLRDWCWPDTDEVSDDGTDENAVALASLPEVTGRVLVIGAGACRLAHDLHRRDAPEHTVAVDIHPLPFLVADRARRGEALPLWEFPVTPKGDVCVQRPLRPPSEPAAPWSFVFADARALPVRAGVFDTVVTPWFIDQVPADLARFLPVIQRALKPGGRWLNLGPLIYRSTVALACRYPIDEVVELAARAGLGLVRPPERAVRRYLCSPASSQGRLEEVYAFEAVRDDAPAAALVPGWTVRDDAPVPRWPGLDAYRPTHPVFAAVAERVDGRASVRAIAASLIRELGIPPEGAEQGVRLTLDQIATDLATQ